VSAGWPGYFGRAVLWRAGPRPLPSRPPERNNPRTLRATEAATPHAPFPPDFPVRIVHESPDRRGTKPTPLADRPPGKNPQTLQTTEAKNPHPLQTTRDGPTKIPHPLQTARAPSGPPKHKVPRPSVCLSGASTFVLKAGRVAACLKCSVLGFAQCLFESFVAAAAALRPRERRPPRRGRRRSLVGRQRAEL